VCPCITSPHTSAIPCPTSNTAKKTFLANFLFSLRSIFPLFPLQLFYSSGRDTNFLLISVEFNFFRLSRTEFAHSSLLRWHCKGALYLYLDYVSASYTFLRGCRFSFFFGNQRKVLTSFHSGNEGLWSSEWLTLAVHSTRKCIGIYEFRGAGEFEWIAQWCFALDAGESWLFNGRSLLRQSCRFWLSLRTFPIVIPYPPTWTPRAIAHHHGNQKRAVPAPWCFIQIQLNDEALQLGKLYSNIPQSFFN